MSPTIRQAVAADQASIRRIVWAARINPRDLGWRRFLVAEEQGRVVGVGQVKSHRDGCRELASLAVISERQGHGVGGALVLALQARERGPLYLMCRGVLEGYYVRFGFVRVQAGALPPYFRRIARLARAAAFVSRLFGYRPELIVMRWDEDSKT